MTEKRQNVRRRFVAGARLSSGPSRAFTYIEVLISIFVVSIALVPSITMIQQTRILSKSVGYNLIGMNLSVAMMELVKRSGYNEVEYGDPMPGILDVADAPSPLLDFPRTNADGSETDIDVLQAGIAGGATQEELDDFLQSVRDGDPDRESPVVTSDENYLFFSREQIAAMNGVADLSALTPEEQAELLNPGYAWGIAISDGDPADEIGAGFVNTGLKKIVIVVKWTDVRRGFRDFVVLETYISEMATRM